MNRRRLRIACRLAAALLATNAALAQAPEASPAPEEAPRGVHEGADAAAHESAPATEVQTDKFCKNFRLDVGERSSGDKYIAGKTVVVSGFHDGDLAIVGESAAIEGEVTGDVFFFGDSLDIAGHVHDTVRAMANSLSVSGTVDGDLVVFGNQMAVRHGGRVTGDVLGFCARMRLEGDVDRDVRLTGGEIQMAGKVGGNAWLKTDTLVFSDRARVEGDLSYQSNRKLDPEVAERVGGEVEFRERVEEPEEPEDEPLTAGGVFRWLVWWAMWALGSVLIGLAWIGLARPAVDRARDSIGTEPLMSGLIGFGAFLVLPAASLIMTLVTPPFGLAGWLLFGLLLLLAKIPVGVWLGDRILRLVGRGAPSARAALLLGVPLLYLAAELPWFLGLAIWALTTWLGLGATLHGHFTRRDSAGTPEPTAG